MNKYNKWYNNITSLAQTRTTTEYTETHHIVPRSLGGTDDKSNLTKLTAREHFICHWLLVKIYPVGDEHWKMLNAFRMMRAENPVQQRYKAKITGRVYANLKEEYSILQSEKVSGKNNPMHGDKFYRSEDGKRRQSQAISGEKNGSKQIDARAKISISKLGKIRAPFSEEWKAKLSKSGLGENNSRYGAAVSEETRKKIGDKIRGRKQTDEEKEKRRVANLGKTRTKKHCSHCQQSVAVNGYARWHGDNCKQAK